MILAQAGTLVVCPNGHRICRVAKDIVIPGKVRAELFCDWHYRFPRKFSAYDPIPDCPECGEAFLRPNATLGRWQLHTADGWR